MAPGSLAVQLRRRYDQSTDQRGRPNASVWDHESTVAVRTRRTVPRKGDSQGRGPRRENKGEERAASQHQTLNRAEPERAAGGGKLNAGTGQLEARGHRQQPTGRCRGTQAGRGRGDRYSKTRGVTRNQKRKTRTEVPSGLGLGEAPGPAPLASELSLGEAGAAAVRVARALCTASQPERLRSALLLITGGKSQRAGFVEAG